jgi:chaperone required for assembly of F1-ATPase
MEVAKAMKRFYKDVLVEADAGGWRVLLDGRGIRTAGRRAQIVPTQALARAMAAEWTAQGEQLDAALFRLREIADYAIDIVAPDRAAAIHDLLPYGETDTLCYRGDPGEPLTLRQEQLWEPLLVAAERRWDVHFERIGGVVHRPQPPATLARLATVLATESDFSLAALRELASLANSLVIALAAIAPDADPQALWQAANLEEDWQAELWGKVAEAQAHRARRFSDFVGAMLFAQLAR